MSQSSLRLSDLPQYLGKVIVVQEDTSQDPDTDDDFKEYEGKVVRADESGLVLETRHGTRIIRANRILDADVSIKSTVRRLVRRWLREPTPATVRQHLLDRHGMPFDLISAKEMDNEAYYHMHQGINHAGLGHRHGEKPKRGQLQLHNGEEVEEVESTDDSDE